MSESKTLPGICFSPHVDLDQPHQLHYWCAALGCSADELRACVRSVGRQLADVQAALAARRRRGALARIREVIFPRGIAVRFPEPDDRPLAAAGGE